LEFISRSMRAGHAFSVSLEMIHREFQEPLAGEFRRTFEEHNLGLPLDVALQSLAKRVPLLDVHFFVSAVLLQKRTGGNLAEILDKLAYIIRERFKLRGRIRAISAHGKLTGLALTCIPIGVAIMMFYTNPDYVKFFFTDETGNIMLGTAVFLQITGYLIMKKIVTIEV
jgi:tight adherence protein B